jgi:hypothetical protein
LIGQCKQLNDNLDKAAKEKEELVSQCSELVRMKESRETQLNAHLTAALESGNNSQRQGINWVFDLTTYLRNREALRTVRSYSLYFMLWY